MKLLVLLTLLCLARPALAAGELYLTWNDCALAASAAHDRGSACASSVGSQTLYCAFRMPFPADSVLGVDLVLDLQHEDPTLPAWWDFSPSGCRAGKLQASFDFSVNTSCTEFWFNEEAGALQGYFLGQPRGGPSQARIKIGAAVLPTAGYRALNATDMYYAVKLTISNALTTGVPQCDGCLGPACLVLNSIAVRRQPGAPGGDILIDSPGAGDANRATWQGGSASSCQAVPARRVTWGRIKGLYR